MYIQRASFHTPRSRIPTFLAPFLYFSRSFTDYLGSCLRSKSSCVIISVVFLVMFSLETCKLPESLSPCTRPSIWIFHLEKHEKLENRRLKQTIPSTELQTQLIPSSFSYVAPIQYFSSSLLLPCCSCFFIILNHQGQLSQPPPVSIVQQFICPQHFLFKDTL